MDLGHAEILSICHCKTSGASLQFKISSAKHAVCICCGPMVLTVFPVYLFLGGEVSSIKKSEG